MNNDSSTPQRQLANVFTQAFLQHLQNASNDNNANTAMGNIVRQIFANVSLATPSPVTPTTRPRTPADMRFTAVNTPEGTAVNTPEGAITNSEPDTPLSRTSSMSSTTSNNGSDVDFEIRRRNPTLDQIKMDNRAVTPRLLAIVDAPFLALHPDVQNPMFRRKFKRGCDAFGKKTLKRYKDIVLPVFRDQTRQALRMLVARDFPTLRAQDPKLTHQELRTRYYNAALRVVKKRRANHVQSWRPDKNGNHLPLIYGGVFTAVPPGALPSVTPPPAPSAGAATITTAPSAVATTTPPPAPSAGVATIKTAPSAVATTTPVDFPDEKQMFCSCGVELSAATAFPKDRWGEDAQVSCEKCWTKVQSAMVRKHIQDVQKRKSALQQVNAGCRKRAKRTQCKHCGSKTHFTMRSKECPYNKTKKKDNAPPAVTQVQNDDDEESDNTPAVAQVQTDDDDDESVEWDGSVTEEEVFDPLSDHDQSPPAATTTSRPRPQRAFAPEFAPIPGDNVLVNEGNRVFLGQLFEVRGDKYHVYFVGASDGDDVRVVTLDQLMPERTPSRKRRDFLNAEFYFDGAHDLACGRWKVRRIKGNEFVCVRLSGGKPSSQSIENFDISYVMHEVRAEEEYVRERGPGCPGRR